jgi:hypothetical protein
LGVESETSPARIAQIGPGDGAAIFAVRVILSAEFTGKWRKNRPKRSVNFGIASMILAACKPSRGVPTFEAPGY